ncbi:hypothetical protein Taro_038816, partial [Colocasia esculenta]|nr:hypothetical protein [Colocasia esculenta]
VKDRIRRFQVRGPNSSPGARSRAADAIIYGHPFAQTGITFRSVIGIAYKTKIRNRLSEALDALYCLSSDSLDYANRWRSPHAEPPSHNDQKSCSTRHEISSPGRIRRSPVRRPNSSPGVRSRAADAITYGHPFAQTGITFRSVIRITYKTPIRNRHSEALNAPLLPQRLPRLRESLAEPTSRATQSQRSEVVFNSTLDLLLRSWIWVPEHRRYSHPLWFIPTPSAKELGTTFRTGIRIAYATTIRNRHSETVDRVLVLWNSVSGPKVPPKACVLVHRLPYPPVGRVYLFARRSEPPTRPQFRIGTSTRSVKGGIWRFLDRRPNSSPGAGRHFGVEKPSFRTPKLRFKPTISPIPSSDSLDYANHWWSQHAEPPSHSDQKSCSIRPENSSPGCGYGCPNIADIVTPSDLLPPLQ